MPQVPSHCTVETAVPHAAWKYFAPERETLASYLDLVPDTIDPGTGDGTLGPVHALPWFYVADLTGWRGFTLARLLAAERECPCYRLSPLARDGVESLWGVLDRSVEGPVVVHVELREQLGVEHHRRVFVFAPRGVAVREVVFLIRTVTTATTGVNDVTI